MAELKVSGTYTLIVCSLWPLREEEMGVVLNRNQTYYFPVTSLNMLPMGYGRLVGTLAMNKVHVKKTT